MPAIFSATTCAVLPLMPVSISSNTMVGTAPCLAAMDLMASISLESSPPEAIFDRGFKGSPGLGEIMKET